MVHGLKKFLGKGVLTLGVVLAHRVRNPPEEALSDTEMFLQNGQTSCLSDPKLMARASAPNQRGFLDKGLHALTEISLWLPSGS
jgi:hypothetical protein